MKLKAHHFVGGRRLRRLAAFTMVEIALALAVIAFALVAIIGVLPAGMSVQRDNRESTLINFDADFLMDALKSGTVGLDDLTNHILSISNSFVFFDVSPTGVVTPSKGVHWIQYTTTNTTSDRSIATASSVLTNGANIIMLLSTPKYIPAPALGGFYSNYVSADFRAITGALADQGASQSARDFSFTYRVYPEIIPYFAANLYMPVTNSPDNGLMPNNYQSNYTQIRLRFRWPILPNGQMGNSRLTFRSGASGFLALRPSLVGGAISNAFIQQGTYVAAGTQ